MCFEKTQISGCRISLVMFIEFHYLGLKHAPSLFSQSHVNVQGVNSTEMDGHHDDDGHGHGMSGNTEGVALYKLEAILITLVIALAGGLLPTRRKISPTVLSLGNCFSGGIFISAAFLHMLQESVEGFATLPIKTHFPLAMLCTVIGILIPFFIEKVVLGGNHDHAALLNADKSKSDSGLGIYVLWLMLGVHSLIEGTCHTCDQMTNLF